MKKNKLSFLALLVALLLFLSFNSVNASTEVEIQSQVNAFLTQVACLDENKFEFTGFNFHTNSYMGSTTQQLVINANITYDNQGFALTMKIVHQKVVFYSLTLLKSSTNATTISRETALDMAKSFIEHYGTLFDAAYVDEITKSLSDVSNQDSVIESENSFLEIIYANVSDNGMEYASYSWSKKIDGIKIPSTVYLSITKTGLVTTFYNDLELYQVVVTNDLISEEQAMALGKQYIDTYAEENDRNVVAVESEFRYAKDRNYSRGETLTIYPAWAISATFSETNEEGVYGYSVVMWADTGEVYSFGPNGYYLDYETEESSNYLLLAITGTALAFVLAIATIYLVKKKNIYSTKKIKNYFFTKASFLTSICLLCTLSMCQVCAADPSFVLGSRFNVSAAEIQLATTLAGQIIDASSVAGYSTYNWYGQSTTANNIYIAAYGYGSSWSHSFYIGHGVHSGYWCLHGLPWEWYLHEYVAITDDNGNEVRDHDIFINSAYENPYQGKLVVLWSCHQAEIAMGSYTSYPCGWVANGMPCAWNHNTGLSSNGYTNPDAGDEAFIGFLDQAPFLTDDGFGVDDASYWFLLAFYWATMCDGQTINNGLNYASLWVWDEGFTSCPLYTGYDLPSGTEGQMVIYGNGNLYL